MTRNDTAASGQATAPEAEDGSRPGVSSRRSALFAGLLLLSGFCGISYEILYARLLGNLVGDQFAVSVSILMTFLFGIGIGTRFAHRLWRRLWLIEASIGYCGLLFAVFADRLDGWVYAGLPLLGHGLGSSILLCVILLCIPAFLIGCSLPLFAGYLGRMQSGRIFARAYTLYNFGAAITALTVEFWILRDLGLRWTLVAMASSNILTATGLFLGFRDIARLRPPSGEPILFPRRDKLALAVVSVGSAVFQLVMVNTAECILGPYHETFALVLAIVLLGIAVGSALTAGLRMGFGAVLALNLIGLAWYLGGLTIVSGWYAAWYPSAVESYGLSVLLKFGALLLVMGLPAVSFGATIPALLTTQKHVARESGELLFISSIANAAGFLVMAFVLHRHLDYGPIVLVVAALSGLGLILKYGLRLRPVIVTAVLLSAVFSLERKAWDENLLYLGHTSFHSTKELAKARRNLKLPEKYKGYQDVFAINRIGGRDYFFINGYLSIPLSSPSEKIVGAFSSIFAPRTDRALVLGVGSGATAGTVGRLFDKTDAVEINQAVLENLFRMSKYNFDIEHNPRVTITHDDAIHYTRVCDQQYSLIINTVTTPLYFSSSKLYTDDFLSVIRQRLTPGGIYVTWVDSRVGDRGLDIVLKTVGRSFNHCAIGCVKASYFLLICSNEPIRPRHPNLVARDKVLSRYFLAGHGLLPQWMSYGLLTNDAFTLLDDVTVPINTLDYPSLEFEMTRLRKRGIRRFKKRLRGKMSLAGSRKALTPEVAWNPYHLVLYSRALLGDSTITDRWKRLMRNRLPKYKQGLHRAELSFYAGYARTAGTATAHHKYGFRLLRNRRYREAIREFRAALAIDPRHDNAHFNLGACYERLGVYDLALKEYRQELAVDPRDDDVPPRIRRVADKLKHLQPAVSRTDSSL